MILLRTLVQDSPTLRPSTERKTQLGFVLALTCLVITGGASWIALDLARDSSGALHRTQRVGGGLDALFATVIDAQNSYRGYALSGDERYLESYRQASRGLPQALDSLTTEIADNPRQRPRLQRLETLTQGVIARGREIIALRREQGLDAFRGQALGGQGKRLHDELRQLIDEMKSEEAASLAILEQQAERSANIAKAIIVGMGVLALAFIGWALWARQRDRAGRQRAEAELERFFSLSLDFLCIASVDGFFKRVSPAVMDVLGWSVAEFLATPYIDLVHPDDRKATMLEVERQAVRGEKVLQFENRYRHKDGSWRTLSWRSMPQPDGLMYATARDVTDLKHAEAALREAKEHLEARVVARTAELHRTTQLLQGIIESSDDAIIGKTLDGVITSWNPGAEKIFGYTAQEAIGKSITMLIPPERAAEEPRFLATASQGQSIDHFETVRIKKGGERIDVSVSLSPLRSDSGEVIGISKIARDITEGKRAQVRVQAQLARLQLLNQITRAIGERQDPHSIFQVAVNTIEHELPVDFACIALRGTGEDTLTVASVALKSAALARKLALAEQTQIPIDDSGLARCREGELVYEPNIDDVDLPFPRRLSQGGLRSLVVTPLRVESQVFGLLIAARTETESFSSGDCQFLKQLSEHVALAAHQAELNAALQKAYDDLRQTQQAVMQQERLRALGQMASGIAHDINNAISPATLYLDSLLEKEPELNPRVRSNLQTIQRAIDDVAQTVARMREFYRPREEQVTFAPVDLNQVAEQVIELTRARWNDMANRRGIVVEVKKLLGEDLPLVMGAESEIREALTNLIFNALDAMPEGGMLTLRTQATANSVALHVLDTGLGMEEDTRRRCFEPFFTTKGERGTGLGLAMVYGTMKRHRGEIDIDSMPGHGTAVHLLFPVTAPSVDITEEPTARSAPPTGLRILLVDDDPMLLNSLTDILTAEGHLPIANGGGQAGIDAFRLAHEKSDAFDVVITDLGMPQVDGRKVAAAIKALDPAMPVIMLTGWGQRLMAQKEIPAHVDCVLSKPPKMRELREALTLFVARKASSGRTS